MAAILIVVQLADERANYCRENGYPQRVMDLVGDPLATSDDEEQETNDGGRKRTVYLIQTKPERDPRITKFLCWLDERIAIHKRATRGRRGAKQRERIQPEHASNSTLEELSTKIAVDWYLPDFSTI